MLKEERKAADEHGYPSDAKQARNTHEHLAFHWSSPGLAYRASISRLALQIHPIEISRMHPSGYRTLLYRLQLVPY
jgi:hypothetical protein